jgi:hypothetical protein
MLIGMVSASGGLAVGLASSIALVSAPSSNEQGRVQYADARSRRFDPRDLDAPQL